MKPNPSTSHFLLVGNGPYLNRGCEAIVRGTTAILRKEFGNNINITVATFGKQAEINYQIIKETDPYIRHVSLHPALFKKEWWFRELKRRLHFPLPFIYPMLDRSLPTAIAAMEIGGDNYTLDYGIPRRFLDLDNYLQQNGIPVILWGASVGPFETNPDFAKEILGHLRIFKGILAREPVSSNYLRENQVGEHLFEVCDPAFAMEPVAPTPEKLGFEIPEGALGLNFSPLMAKYVTDKDRGEWIQRCIEIVAAIHQETGRPIILIPHVTSLRKLRCDYCLLSQVARMVRKIGFNISCVSNNLSAAETKWVISRCAAFAGARTHSTIAAVSSSVPTISFAYSRKAIGLNQDIFGSLDYCLTAKDLTPSIIAKRMVVLLSNSSQIRFHLQQRLPEILKRTFSAGPILRRILEGRSNP